MNLSAEYPTYRGGEEREKEKAWGEEFGRTGGVESGGRGKGKEEGYCFLSNGAFWAVYVPLERREQFEVFFFFFFFLVFFGFDCFVFFFKEILDELTTFQEYPLEEDEKIETDRFISFTNLIPIIIPISVLIPIPPSSPKQIKNPKKNKLPHRQSWRNSRKRYIIRGTRDK